jgi:RNA polymerase sigma-70 factor, ECF subfamily
VGASCSRLDAWLAADQTSPSEAADAHDRAAALAEAVAELPDDQREVVLAKHCLGLSLAEIAERTGRTPASVAGLLRRGLQALRERLDGSHS